MHAADDARAIEFIRRVFKFRGEHDWPARVTAGPGWETLYANAALGLPIPQDVETATHVVNAYLERLDAL